MSDTTSYLNELLTHRGHRGAHPEDTRLFALLYVPALREAVGDLSWLLGRGYSLASALKLVGDRYMLHERQRLAVSRAACTEASLTKRAAACVPIGNIRNQSLAIDGFNLLITIEAALGGGVVFQGLDHCLRDLSSVHGSYRSVQETERALQLIGDFLQEYEPKSVTWFLDKPVSNSGRLAQQIRDVAAQSNWPWEVELVLSPDKVLMSTDQIAVTSDSVILDHADRWLNAVSYLIPDQIPDCWLIDLLNASEPSGTEAKNTRDENDNDDENESDSPGVF